MSAIVSLSGGTYSFRRPGERRVAERQYGGERTNHDPIVLDQSVGIKAHQVDAFTFYVVEKPQEMQHFCTFCGRIGPDEPQFFEDLKEHGEQAANGLPALKGFISHRTPENNRR